MICLLFLSLYLLYFVLQKIDRYIKRFQFILLTMTCAYIFRKKNLNMGSVVQYIMKAFSTRLPRSNLFLSCVDTLYKHTIMYVAFLHRLQCSDIPPPHRFLFLGGSKDNIGKTTTTTTTRNLFIIEVWIYSKTRVNKW